jgi:hypothetical protein
VFRQRLAAALLSRPAFGGWQTGVRQVDHLAVLADPVVFIDNLLGFIEEAIDVLFASRRKTMEPRQRQLFLELDHAGAERFLLGFQRGDFGSICRQLRHQRCNVRIAGSYHPILESEPPLCVNSSIRHLQPAI